MIVMLISFLAALFCFALFSLSLLFAGYKKQDRCAGGCHAGIKTVCR